MVRPGEVNYLECDHLGAVVSHVSEGDPPKRDGLFAQDLSIEKVRATLELVTGKTQPLKGVKIHEVEAAAPIHAGLILLGRPDQWVNNEGKPPWLRDAIGVVRSVKSDRGLRPV
jgi:hypothetical protein